MSFFSSEVKNKGKHCIVILAMCWTSSYLRNDAISLKTFCKRLSGFPKESEKYCVNICNDVDI